jgi:hypothetical protein
MDMDYKSGIRKITCKLFVHFKDEDDHIWRFDDSWNIVIGEFSLSNLGGDKLQMSFIFNADIVKTEETGNTTMTIPYEGLEEFQPCLEKIEVLLDMLTLHCGIPLTIEDGSFVFNGGGYASSSNPVINTVKLNDVSGLQKRFANLIGAHTDMSNAIRFFRLSQLDKDYNGKAVKLWSSLEALYKGYEKSEETICKKLTKSEKKQILDAINNQTKLSDPEKKRLTDIVCMQKLSSKSTLLSKKLKLMNSSGDYKEEEIKELVAWWSDARNAPSHGEVIKRDDEERQNAVDDCENTVEMLLQSAVTPSMHAYFIGHPSDVDQNFWDENDSTITKKSADCWIKPTPWDTYLLENMGHHKVGNNMPLLYVTHNKIYKLSKEGYDDVSDVSNLPKHYQDAVKKVQTKLNSNKLDT